MREYALISDVEGSVNSVAETQSTGLIIRDDPAVRPPQILTSSVLTNIGR